jgi:hypothetical protein
MEALGIENDVELTVLFDHIAFTERAGDNFHEICPGTENAVEEGAGASPSDRRAP